MIGQRGVLLIALVGLTGCSAKYGCKGLPDDPTCLSAVEAYRATEQRAVTQPPDGKVTHAPGGSMGSVTSLEPTPEPSPAPRIEDPTPIRTPSQVMRIWIAPWEDAEGDLNVSGYVYTELEPRRWMIGKPTQSMHPSITPLQVQHRQKPEDRKNGVAEEKDRGAPMPPLYGVPEATDH